MIDLDAKISECVVGVEYCVERVNFNFYLLMIEKTGKSTYLQTVQLFWLFVSVENPFVH